MDCIVVYKIKYMHNLMLIDHSFIDLPKENESWSSIRQSQLRVVTNHPELVLEAFTDIKMYSFGESAGTVKRL